MIYPNTLNQFISKWKKKKGFHNSLNQNIRYRYKYHQIMQFFQNVYRMFVVIATADLKN